MNFKVNPDRWLPMGQYIRQVIWFLTHDTPPSPYTRDETKWQRRIGHVKTLDGPIHSLWVHWASIRWNWFTTGWHCWRNGHNYKEQFVSRTSGFDLQGEDGYIKRIYNGKIRTHKAVSCAYCGHFKGITWDED